MALFRVQIRYVRTLVYEYKTTGTEAEAVRTMAAFEEPDENTLKHERNDKRVTVKELKSKRR